CRHSEGNCAVFLGFLAFSVRSEAAATSDVSNGATDKRFLLRDQGSTIGNFSRNQRISEIGFVLSGDRWKTKKVVKTSSVVLPGKKKAPAKKRNYIGVFLVKMVVLCCLVLNQRYRENR
ncbi:hypothetical protein U1Q18_026935, partial [Sarracenia purpurea var. burkii]